jgi:hypothetical protein
MRRPAALAAVIEAAEKQGKLSELPDDILTPATVTPDLEPEWRLFWILSTARAWSATMGAPLPQPIPVSEIVAGARAHGLAATRDDLEATIEIVQAADREWIKVHMEGQQTDASKTPLAVARGSS